MTYSTNSFTAALRSSGSTIQSGSVQSSQYTDSGTTPSSSGEAIFRDGSSYYTTQNSRIEQLQRVDVTDQIRQYNELYGSSNNTQQGGLAASKSLNYATAPTIQQSQHVGVTVYPFTFRLVGQVGLFGAENYYLRVDVNLLTPLAPEFEEPGYEPAVVTFGDDPIVNTYEPAFINFDLDPPPPDPDPEAQVTPEQQPSTTCCAFIGGTPADPLLNCYYGARFLNVIPTTFDPWVSIDLNNIGVNNIYIDTWLDTMLYTRERRMWGYDRMYVRPKDVFYVGIHARNTRHLPYNVNVTVGLELLQGEDIVDKDLIAYNNPS